MKLFLKSLAILLILFLSALLALNLYFTDDRLREIILPQINEQLNREVQIEHLSMTFFKTFPHIGMQLDGLMVPDDDGEPVIEADEVLVSVRFFPLLRREADISQLDIRSPGIFYTRYDETTTNFDFLFSNEDLPEEDPESVTIRIPRLTLQEADIHYNDRRDSTRIDLLGLNAELALVFDETIENSIEARLDSLSVSRGETTYVKNLPLQLTQSSTLDLNQERLTLNEASFSIRGLALDLSGTVDGWSSGTSDLDLTFASASDDFEALLGLVPPAYDEMIRDLEAEGTLALDGSIQGIYSEGNLPQIYLSLNVRDGLLKYPDLDEPIQNIAISLSLTNDELILEHITARAAGNVVEADGRLDHPFEEFSPFQLTLDGNVDLSTLHRFYPVGNHGIESLSGTLTVQGTADGDIRNPKESSFDTRLLLSNGYLKYLDAPLPIEEISADIEATHELARIVNASMRASSNHVTISGTVAQPLEEQPEYNITGNLDLDLTTLKEFYPINEDTLLVRGQLRAEATLRGRADNIQQSLYQSTIELRDGYFAHRLVKQPLENITFLGSASSNRLEIREGQFNTGNNSLSLNGTIDNYMEASPYFDLSINGDASLSDVSAYYSLEPWINDLNGSAVLNLQASGPAGDPRQIALNGTLELSDVSATGDSLSQPITSLQGRMSITPTTLNLETFSMYYGSSDFNIEGRLQNYLGLLDENESESTIPTLTGSYRARMLNLDEMMNWDEDDQNDDDIEYPIHLPRIQGTVTANIDTLMVMGVAVTNVRGNGRTTPESIRLEQAEAVLFEGTATGNMTWFVPRPDRTRFHFEGELENVQASTLLREFPLLGKDSRFSQHVTGAFNGSVEYETEMDIYLNPDLLTTQSEGTFELSRARMRDHPVQLELARWLKTPGLNNLAMDGWDASFSIDEGVFTFSDFQLTSENIGIQLEGTQNLISNNIHFTTSLLLPDRFKNGLSTVLPSRATEALTREDGIMVVPVEITGTMGQPRISARQSVIDNIVRDAALDAGRNVLRQLFDGN